MDDNAGFLFDENSRDSQGSNSQATEENDHNTALRELLYTYDYEHLCCLIEREKETDYILYCALMELQERQIRRWQVRPLFQLRPQYGAYETVVEPLRHTDIEKYFNYMRMFPETFDHLLSMLIMSLEKTTKFRQDVVSPKERLAITLRYLISGESMNSLSYNFKVGESTVTKIIPETCLAIWNNLSSIYVSCPTPADFQNIATNFEKLWDMPNCVGAIDGKHIVIQAFPGSGSIYYNYKGSHSIVLMAVCDAQYNFTMVDVGAEGKNSDGGVYKTSDMGIRIADGTLQFPDDAPLKLKPDGPALPHFLVGDEAFPLSRKIMRPYPGRSEGNMPLREAVYNYRHSRARRCIENTFGIMVARFRLLRKPILACENTVRAAVLAIIALHNYLKYVDQHSSYRQHMYCPPGFGDYIENGVLHSGAWRENGDCLTSLHVSELIQPPQALHTPQEIRNVLADYFMTEGAVPWQYDRVQLGGY